MTAPDLLTPVAVEHICHHCSHITDLGNVAHHKVGLRNCAHLPAWQFVPGHHSCEKWSAK